MSDTKKMVINILDNLPDSATLEDIQYHIYVQEKIQKALKAIDDWEIISQDEFDDKVKK